MLVQDLGWIPQTLCLLAYGVPLWNEAVLSSWCVTVRDGWSSVSTGFLINYKELELKRTGKKEKK